MKKLAIVMTHPVQYQVPWLALLAKTDIQVKVYYTWEQSSKGMTFDSGFGKNIKWDIPLLDGYDYEFVKNSSRRPGLDTFLGIINPGLIRSIEAWGPDRLLVLGWNYHSHLRCLLHFHKKIPVFFRGDSVLLHEKPGLRKLARRIFLTWVYRHVDFALYVGTNNKSYYLKHGLQPSQLVFSPQAIDIDRFSNPDAAYTHQAQSWKKSLGIPSHHLTVLYAGKMTEVKNPAFMLVLAEACKALPVSFVLVGDGYLKEGLKKQSEGNRNIMFMDFQNQSVMPAVYRMGDVFIMPSVSETWGMGVNEAMACGIPVMASENVGCAADLVVENKTGITFAIDEPDKCVRFIESLCQDRTRLVEMGLRSTDLIQSFSLTYTVDSMARALA